MVAQVAVALHITPEEVWTMDTADLMTVIDVLYPPEPDPFGLREMGL